MKIALGNARRIARVSLLSLLASGNAVANFTCEGQIDYLSLNPDGSANISLGFGVWGICNVSTTVVAGGGTTFTAESCRAWFASMLASQKAGDPLRFYFSSSANSNNGPECSALGNWVWPNPSPYHMHIMH